ncbi:PAS domain S-box protein [Candidatus Thorarchaeota archaeon]|nr:MAG: PAS domain S-box protein [Candidatus Thorarchaeota archaeon]
MSMTDPDAEDKSASMANDARRYRVLVESMNEGFAVINRDRQFTFVNKALASMLAMEPDEIVGKYVDDFLDGDDREYLKDRLTERFAGESSKYRLTWTRPDSVRIETVVSGSPLQNEAGKVIGAFAVIRDITREREMQEALETGEARYSKVLEALPASVILMDLDGEITSVNGHAVDMHGFDSKEDLVGRNITDLVAEDRLDEARAHIKKAIEEGEARGIEFGLSRKDGSTFQALIDTTMMYDAGGNPQYMIGVAHNIEPLKRARAATERSELTFRRTFEAIPGPAYIWEKQDDDIVLTMVNRRIIENTRGRMREFVGRSVDSIFDDCPEIRNAIRGTMETGERISFEMPFGLHPGREGWFLFAFVRLTDGVVLMVTTDLTDRKHAEELAKENEALFRATVEATVDGVIVISTTGEIIHYNQKFASMMKMGTQVLQGDEADINTHIAQQMKNPAFYASRHERIQLSGEDSFDTLFFRDGRVIERTSSPLLLEGEKTGRVWNYRDVTEREAIEDALQESETKYRQLVEQSFQGIIIVRADPLGIMFANQVMAEMLGMPVEEILNLGPDEIRRMIHHEDMRAVVVRMDALLSGGKPKTEPLVLRISRKDGDMRLLEAFARGIEYEGIPCIQVVLTDVTERTIARKEIQSEKERAMLYLDLLSHDFRNMLQVVIGSVAILEERNTDPLSRSAIRNIVESVERCQSLISKVRTTEPLDPSRLDPVRIYDVIVDTVNRFRTLNDDTEIRLMVEDRDAVVMAGRSLRHLFSNLLENAINHNDKMQKTVWVSLSTQNSGYSIRVSDNGPGIPERTKEGLFDISRRFGGIGLHQSRQIVEKLGGRIEVQDRVPGDYTKGAQFVIWLPGADAFPLDAT